MVISAWTCIDLGFILKVCKNLALQSIPLIQCNVFQPCCAIQCQAKRQGKRQNRLASAVSVLNIWNMSHVWVDRVKQHMRSNPWHQTRPPRSCTSNRQRRRLRLSHAESTVWLSIPALDFKIPAACAIETISPNAGLQVDSVWPISTYFNETTRQHTIDPKSAWIAWWVLQFAYTDSWSGKPWTVESWESSKWPGSRRALSLRFFEIKRYHEIPSQFAIAPTGSGRCPVLDSPIHLKIPPGTIWDNAVARYGL